MTGRWHVDWGPRHASGPASAMGARRWSGASKTFTRGYGGAMRRSVLMAEPDVLTDIPGRPGRFWGSHTRFVGPANPPRWLVRLAGERWAYNLKGSLAALRLYVRRG